MSRLFNAQLYYFYSVNFVNTTTYPNSYCISDNIANQWGWGYNDTGELGLNDSINRYIPNIIKGSSKKFCNIQGGNGHVIALDDSGACWSWGFGLMGQLGNGSSDNRCTPVLIHGTKTYCKIAATYLMSMAIDTTGLIWGWGWNRIGVLGNDNVGDNIYTPVSIHGARKTFCEIAMGDSTSMGIDLRGRLWSWGGDYSGALGTNTVNCNRCIPVSVHTNRTYCKISVGYIDVHVLALDNLGVLWAWGANSGFTGFGCLGDGTTVDKCIPISVHGGITFCKISAGERVSVGIDNNGQVWGWGRNAYGQIGDNSTTNRCVPTSIHGTKKTFCEISSNHRHVVAIDNHSQVWSWGRNDRGQLGDNTTVNRLTPVRVFKL